MSEDPPRAPAAIRRLTPADDAKALELHIQGVSNRDIGQQLGVSDHTAKKAISRAAARLTKERTDTDVEQLRTSALLAYDDLAAELRERLRKTPLTSPAASGLANALVRILERKDRLLGLETIRVDHRVAAWSRLQTVWNDPVTIIESPKLLQESA